ncbi:hypothetical protein V2J09_006444 [Rumex salicifolius]
MTTMDVKAISWVGDMYQKFEAMCVEVEENVYQDSFKYVENQVKTVGICVKRFYSDVVQDLLPVSSDDSLKPENSGLKLVHYANDGICNKSDVDVKSKQVKSENVVLSRDSHLSSQLDEKVDNRLSSGSYNLSSLCQMPPKESTAVECLSLHEQQRATEELCLCNNDKSEKKFGPSDLSDPEFVDPRLALVSNDGESTSGVGNMSDGTAECLATSNTSISNSAVWEEFGNEDKERMSDAVSDEPVWDDFEIDDVDKEAFQSSEQLSKVKLDESCVLVDAYEHFSFPHLDGKQRSYKKKITDVFHLRRWSSSKNLKEGTIREISVSASSLLESDKTNNLQSSSLESGWEIL